MPSITTIQIHSPELPTIGHFVWATKKIGGQIIVSTREILMLLLPLLLLVHILCWGVKNSTYELFTGCLWHFFHTTPVDTKLSCQLI